MKLLNLAVFASAIAGGLASSSGPLFHSSKDENLGGCGWSRCVNCTDTPGGAVVPCGPSHPKCIADKDKPVYTFHLADPTCDINDPNGPFYDPVHKLYHNFYQIHIAEDMGGVGNGPDWGHWVSKDFVKWAQLPIAIWNDRYYDNKAIYTGSTTIVDGKPVIMYPGMCAGECNDGHGGATYVLVTPKNASDPLYTEWTKDGEVGGKRYANPVVNSTGDDPSTAWRTDAGEYRIIGNQGCSPEGGNPLYGSMDFVEWYKIGCTTMMAGDCPTFFELPKLTKGSEHYVARHVRDAPMPDHVHKSGGKGGDQTQVGNWAEGKPGPAGTGTVGTWTLTPGSQTQFLDRGKTHASKDFHDPVKGRQVMWVWGTTRSGIQTIPRDMSYHPGLKRIVYAPVEEMGALHGATIDSLPAPAPLSADGKAGASLTVSGACDVLLTFAVPTAATTLSVSLAGGQSFFVDFAPAPAHVLDSVDAATGAGAPWTVKVGFGGTTDDLPLLPDDKDITLRIFLDGTVAEAYWMGGRVAMTVDAAAAIAARVSASGGAGATLSAAVVHAMGDIHTSVESVLAQL
eukprot:g4367.t1